MSFLENPPSPTIRIVQNNDYSGERGVQIPLTNVPSNADVTAISGVFVARHSSGAVLQADSVAFTKTGSVWTAVLSFSRAQTARPVGKYDYDLTVFSQGLYHTLASGMLLVSLRSG